MCQSEQVDFMINLCRNAIMLNQQPLVHQTPDDIIGEKVLRWRASVGKIKQKAHLIN